jgi:hypothetical protein
MMMSDNPSAFPQSYQNRDTSGAWFTDHDHGMTLRDYFAGQALAMLASESGGEDGAGFYDPKTAAERSYAIADAMLAARTGDA